MKLYYKFAISTISSDLMNTMAISYSALIDQICSDHDGICLHEVTRMPWAAVFVLEENKLEQDLHHIYKNCTSVLGCH